MIDTSLLCPRCSGTGEEVHHQPTIVDDPATITFTVCGRCHGDGTIPRMNLDRAALEHNPVPCCDDHDELACGCGYAPVDNAELDAHWAFYGIKWTNNDGKMEWSRA